MNKQKNINNQEETIVNEEIVNNEEETEKGEEYAINSEAPTTNSLELGNNKRSWYEPMWVKVVIGIIILACLVGIGYWVYNKSGWFSKKAAQATTPTTTTTTTE